jgi:hypothetical protein
MIIGCGGGAAHFAPLIVKPGVSVTSHTLAGTIFDAKLLLHNGLLPNWLVAHSPSHRRNGCERELVIDDSVVEHFNVCLEPEGLDKRIIAICQRRLSVVMGYAPSHAVSVRLRFDHEHDVDFPTIVVEQPRHPSFVIIFQVLSRSFANSVPYTLRSRDGSDIGSGQIPAIARCGVGATQ